MMKASVLVTFLPRERGGRASPFRGSRYATVARIRREGHVEEWSAVIDFGGVVTAGDAPIPGELSFLAAAPEQLARKGVEFELTEGPRTVASARVESVVLGAPCEDDDEETSWFDVDPYAGRGPREARESPCI
jgi:hypothetical protein